MGLSAHARLLIIGIWTEAFDDGVFEWKPLTLKARIFPVDTVDMAALLEELVAGTFVRREEYDGRQIGLIRNFREFQRPKKPNSSGMLRPEWETFVGISASPSEPVPHQFPTDGEKSPQMEDGGGKREDEVTKPSASSRATRWPKGQKVSDEWKAWARSAFPGVEAYRLTTETRQFEDYWPGKLGKDGLRSDWEAEYRMWMRRKFGADEVELGAGADPDLVVLSPGDEDFRLIEVARGKSIIVGKTGRATVTRRELEEARRLSSNSDQGAVH